MERFQTWLGAEFRAGVAAETLITARTFLSTICCNVCGRFTVSNLLHKRRWWPLVDTGAVSCTHCRILMCWCSAGSRSAPINLNRWARLSRCCGTSSLKSVIACARWMSACKKAERIFPWRQTLSNRACSAAMWHCFSPYKNRFLAKIFGPPPPFSRPKSPNSKNGISVTTAPATILNRI